ncbi:PVC-type heme-binding CxxCH protein [Rosistilla ulvae]|uniref:PVC-type heme-binding CxxCH protein n=1 Tax=Rosistilla ulvae TaxID=1930277 RepID=UPI001C54CCD4|nr:PVC-type heme-binding CxxCH protein [Rosistilla ulvae]
MASADTVLRAGAASVDISPRAFPAIRNGGFLSASDTRVADPLHARCLVLSDGSETIAITIVDSCMFPTDICDAIKSSVAKQIDLPSNRILISATHTHSAPSVMAYCLGAGRDEAYAEFVVPRVAEAIVSAHGKLQPAKIGWTAVEANEQTNCRRWITRSDRMRTDPFGQQTVRAMMHPGYMSRDYVCPAGPIDPQLSLLSVVAAADDAPLCLLANYSMHYFGQGAGFSADYFGEVAGLLESGIAANADHAPRNFVGIMSQGTSGDLHWMDYGMPQRGVDRTDYAKSLADTALKAWKQIQHRSDLTIAMAESRMKLGRRVPDAQRLAWAKPINEQRGDASPKNRTEVYAQQATWIHENQETEVVLQAVRIGDLGITALPNEVYGITGLKLKQQSPLASTFNLELANGAEGYIPPPEQHRLGGYTTWPARTAGLEVEAEPKIVERVLSLLESVAGKPRRTLVDPPNAFSQAMLKAHPTAYWRLGDMVVDQAVDATGNHPAQFDGGVALYLEGPDLQETPATTSQESTNRCVYFAGGSMQASVANLPANYSLSMWFWNGLPAGSEHPLATLFARGTGEAQESLSIVSTQDGLPVLAVRRGVAEQKGFEQHLGSTPLATKAWHHVTVIRDGEDVKIYLDGNAKPELQASLRSAGPAAAGFSFGNFDGKLDEIALFDRVLTADEAQAHFVATGTQPVAETKTESSQERKPTPAEASLEKIHVREGFEVQLVASEPLVKDPVAIDWGLDGKLWVVEMADYPLGMDGAGAPGGRIRVLEDQDGDGHYDSSTLFAEGLRFPNGLLVWGDGVLVTAAPEILYLEDSTGDGKADIRRSLYSGFLEGNQQLRVNGLRWGLDNWIHCASGSHHSGYGKGNQITSVLTGQPHQIGSRDFRIRPDNGDIDPQSGPSQYGRNRDDWGNWFGVQNSLPLWHYVLADQDIRRNPYFAPPNPKRQVVTPSNPPVYPAAQLQKRFHSFDQSGRFTSACSAIIYRDDVLFPRVDNQQHAFTCEPFHNLVQHNIISDDGVSFDFRRDPAESEFDFFASQDRWCRPVMARTGPDGALWIVDMYRYMIEHPHWLPQNGKDELRPYYRLGENQGRIYRVVPVGKPLTAPRIATSTAGLISALKSSNGWQRDAAQQNLVRSKDAAAVPQIQSLATSGDTPMQRLQALCTLDGMQALDTEILQAALGDPHAGVRRQAVRLAAEHTVDIKRLKPLVNDPSAKVRLQLAATLGAYDDPMAARLLAQLAVDSADDTYILANVMSSLNQRNIAEVLTATIASSSDVATSTEPQRRLQQQLFGQVAALGDAAAVGQVVSQICDRADGPPKPWQLSGLADLLDGLAKRKFPLTQLTADQQQLIDQSIAQARDSVSATSEQLTPLTAASLRLLLRQPDVYADDMKLLSNLLVPQSAVELQLAVVDRLAIRNDQQVANVMLAGWQSYGPSMRARVLDVLASRTLWSKVLLTSVAAEQVSSGEISPSMRERLLATKDKSLRTAWTKAFTASTSPDRKQVIEQYQAALTLTGDIERGRKVFATSCAACHKFDNVGHSVGPDLASITDKRPATLLANIIDPSAEVEARYLTYTVLTVDGRVHNGLLATETGSSITLLSNEGKSQTILRTEIEELRASNKSLMPEGLEKDLSPQAVADLLALLTAKPEASK